MRGFGYLPGLDIPSDPRVKLTLGVTNLPDESPDVPLTPFTDDQGAQGSCTGQASSNACGGVYLRKTGSLVEFSPRWNYLLGRLALNGLTILDYLANPESVRQRMLADTGAMVSQVIEATATQGNMTAALCPYVVGTAFADLPSPEALASASRHLSFGVEHIENAEECRVACHEGMGIILGMVVPANFDDAGTNGFFAPPTGFLRSGHAMEIVKHVKSKKLPGYSKPGAFLVRNSWGTNWGVPHPSAEMAKLIPGRGFLWLADEFIDSPQVQEVFAVKLVS